MNIVLVSQCSKQALPRTRRILDQFAERKGDRTWLTPITQAGLTCLHQLLRQQARRNTAVACHLIRGSRIELLWIVGNRLKFNTEGSIPTNSTSKDIVGKYKEDGWRHSESIALMASIAGLFHDFGKANKLFQRKLNNSVTGEKGKLSEPLRHEWLSARLFQAFVGEDDDATWLDNLGNMNEDSGELLIGKVFADGHKKKDPGGDSRYSFLHKLKERQVAWMICWLILSHHRLPVMNPKITAQSSRGNTFGSATSISRWEKRMGPDWNSPAFVKGPYLKPEQKDFEDVWTFPLGLPCDSRTWRKRAKSMSQRATEHSSLLHENWRDNTLAQHLARCALMLADHQYSGDGCTKAWQDDNCSAYANTRKQETDPSLRVMHQKLDEHCIGVSDKAYWVGRSLPAVRAVLPAVSDVRALKRPAKGRFQWQNKAYALAVQGREISSRQGGFFLNMASTGTGKTLANARVVYGLSDPRVGCRFSVLLGLRSLTLQTGDALRDRTGLESSELAVMIGSSAVKKLHDLGVSNAATSQSGSESAEPFFSQHEYIAYDGALDQSRVGQWLAGKGDKRGADKLKTLLSAPVLISTIDRIMPATESARGGHQIAPMLRLLTSDTVFDEPDDFGLKDLPALCRLVHWAGLLGSRVVFSSATLSPALVEALFDAYSTGRQEFNRATLGKHAKVFCGWIDEFRTQHETVSDTTRFIELHTQFVKKRLLELAKHAETRRWAEIVPLVVTSDVLRKNEDAFSAEKENWNSIVGKFAHTIAEQVGVLHQRHSLSSPDGRVEVSIGLVRLANIDPLAAIAAFLAGFEPPPDTRWHMCVYHSRHPLARRDHIERILDNLLMRHDPETLWAHEQIQNLQKYPEKNQIFVVIATDVATTGRDHHYDWAIVEPSSMRSIVQIAGRVRRHHSKESPAQPNMVLLNQNVRALRGSEGAVFTRPGFEGKALRLQSTKLDEVTVADEVIYPRADPCILEAENLQPEERLVDLEHKATRDILFAQATNGSSTSQNSDNLCAEHWWREPVRWSYQLQAHTRFRKSQPESLYALIAEELGDEPIFFQQNKQQHDEWVQHENEFKRVEVNVHERVVLWTSVTDIALLEKLDEQGGEHTSTCQCFMNISLRDKSDNDSSVWTYHPWLGVFSDIEY